MNTELRQMLEVWKHADGDEQYAAAMRVCEIVSTVIGEQREPPDDLSSKARMNVAIYPEPEVFDQSSGPGEAPPKLIVGGKKFELDKLELIWRKRRGHYGDFSCWEQWLYRSPHGRWLFIGEGGPLTQYSQPYEQNGRRGGWRAQHINDAEAKRILISSQEIGVVEALFGDLEAA